MSAKQRELSGFSWRGKQKLKFPPTHINKFNYFKYVFVISFNLKEKKITRFLSSAWFQESRSASYRGTDRR